jgi:hypothetical protein
MIMVCSIGASAATTSNATSFNTSQITQASGNVKHYVENDYGLSNTVKVGNKSVTEPQFLYLMTAATKNIGNGKSSSKVTLTNVSASSTATETLTSGKLTRAEYLSLASKINSYITNKKKSPSTMSTSIGTMKFQSLVYMYSKVLAYYNTYKVLPSTVSMSSWYATTLGPSGTLNGTIAKDLTNKKYKTLGGTSYGYVNLLGPFGTGKNKVAIIVGVHPQEVQTHIAMLNAISDLSSQLKNVQIWVYMVVVTKDVSNYSLGRTHGQNLAQAYVVPNVIKSGFKLVMDCHGNRGNYYVNGKMVTNSMYAPSNGASSNYYSNKIINYSKGNLVHYTVVDGTSPKYVTLPIAAKGIPAIIYEQYLNQANYAKVLFNNAEQVLKGLNAAFA